MSVPLTTEGTASFRNRWRREALAGVTDLDASETFRTLCWRVLRAIGVEQEAETLPPPQGALKRLQRGRPGTSEGNHGPRLAASSGEAATLPTRHLAAPSATCNKG